MYASHQQKQLVRSSALEWATLVGRAHQVRIITEHHALSHSATRTSVKPSQWGAPNARLMSLWEPPDCVYSIVPHFPGISSISPPLPHSARTSREAATRYSEVMARTLQLALLFSIFFPSLLALPTGDAGQYPLSSMPASRKDAKVLVLGGGMAGITAARALHDQGIDDFIVIEGRHELGGRMMSHTFGAPERQYTVELGANWIQGTQSPGGPENPIWTLAKTHALRTKRSEYFEGLGTKLCFVVTRPG